MRRKPVMEIDSPHHLKSDTPDAIKFAWELPVARQRYIEIHIRRSTLIAVIASLLVHALLLFTLQQEPVRIEHSLQDTQKPLVVQLTPPTPAVSAPVPPPAKRVPVPPAKNPRIQPEPAPRQTSKPQSKPREPDRPAPPPEEVMAATKPPRPLPKPSLNTSLPPAAPATGASPAPDSARPTDMMSYIEDVRSRRQTVEQADAATGAQRPTSDEIRADNIQRNLQPGGTNGVFQILSMGVRTAQFSFRGWTTDSSNYRREVIEVDAGLNGDVERAIVRRMIELIRDHYPGDFNWESHRLNRVIVLSARKEDHAGLEDFLMREFFMSDGSPRAR